jgi:hypothetical protein
LVKKGKLRFSDGRQTSDNYDIPNGIIAYLTRKCRGNVHHHHVVDVTCGSFEEETDAAGQSDDAMEAADLKAVSCFWSACRNQEDHISHTRNNWLCYDFKERRIVPTHYAIRTYNFGSGNSHLKSWLVETSADGEHWREIAREEENEQLNGPNFTGTFTIAAGEECRFIRLVNIGRNHGGNDWLVISAWEIFGSPIV